MFSWITDYFNWLTDPNQGTALSNLWNHIASGNVSAVDISAVNPLADGVRSVVDGAIASLFASMVSLLPPGGGFPPVFHDAAIHFGNVYQSLNFIFPTSVLSYCIFLVIEVQFALWAFHALLRIFNWLRGVPTENAQTDFTFYGAAWNRK